MNPLNIALTFPGCHRRGGVERIVFECASFLARRNHKVTVFAADYDLPPSPNLTHHPISIRRKPSFASGTSFFERCSRELDPAAFNVMNSHGCVCPLGGVHWVQSVHRAWLDTCRRFRAPFSFSRIRQRLNPLHPLLLRLEERHFKDRNFKTVIATTPQVKADLSRYYGLHDSDVHIIPNGFNPADFNPTRRASLRQSQRQKLGLTPDHIALLFVANELERKGYYTILRAMQVLNNPNLRLVAIGRPNVALVQRIAADHGLAHQVLACGPASDVGAFHAAADLFVLPTQYEAFCLAILESLGSGLPVITSNVPGAADAIVPGINGAIIQDPSDGEELAHTLAPLLNPAAIAALSATTPATSVPYQWNTVLERYEQLLHHHAA